MVGRRDGDGPNKWEQTRASEATKKEKGLTLTRENGTRRKSVVKSTWAFPSSPRLLVVLVSLAPSFQPFFPFCFGAPRSARKHGVKRGDFRSICCAPAQPVRYPRCTLQAARRPSRSCLFRSVSLFALPPGFFSDWRLLGRQVRDVESESSGNERSCLLLSLLGASC